jgi:23S rRNA pseudouridine1911/1915/1917 synthase
MKRNPKLKILHEDKDIIVIDKPAGMLSVSTDRGDEVTAYRLLNDYLRNKRTRVWIVHRLDRDTSGVLLFAKNERVKAALQDDWESMAISREYVAVVQGQVNPPEGQVKSWLKQNKSLIVYSCPRGREGDGKLAVTNYRVMKSGAKYSLLAISLETGRKNQIRVHMKDLGCPVVGDKKYGATANPLGRLGLHATLLVVKHPTRGTEMRFESEVPEGFRRV